MGLLRNVIMAGDCGGGYFGGSGRDETFDERDRLLSTVLQGRKVASLSVQSFGQDANLRKQGRWNRCSPTYPSRFSRPGALLVSRHEPNCLRRRTCRSLRNFRYERGRQRRCSTDTHGRRRFSSALVGRRFTHYVQLFTHDTRLGGRLVEAMA